MIVTLGDGRHGDMIVDIGVEATSPRLQRHDWARFDAARPEIGGHWERLDHYRRQLGQGTGWEVDTGAIIMCWQLSF